MAHLKSGHKPLHHTATRMHAHTHARAHSFIGIDGMIAVL